MGSTFKMRSFVRDYISLKHIWDNIMMEKLGTISVPGERFHQSVPIPWNVKQIHFNMDYMALNVIQPVPNPEQDHEPLNQPNQPPSQSNSPISLHHNLTRLHLTHCMKDLSMIQKAARI
ncbi:hypothetical protein ACOSQ3_032438 [Xanthoceras sorbifolium]